MFIKIKIKKEQFNFIFIFFVGIIVGIFLIWSQQHFFKDNIDSAFNFIRNIIYETDVNFYVFNNKLSEEHESFIVVNNLVPIMKVEKNKIINNIKNISIDNGPNILVDNFPGVEIEDNENELSIKFQYAIFPGKHTVDIITVVGGKEILQKFTFILLIEDNFNLSLDQSKLWGIPETTKEKHQKNWYTEDSSLKIDSLPPGPHASLAFLYTFNDNVTIDFYLRSLSEVTNLVVYFLKSGKSVLIGNGNNYTTWMLYNGEGERGQNFLIEPNHQYRVRIVRDNFVYKLFIKEVHDEKIHDFVGVFSNANPTLTFVDEEPDRMYDHIGFTLWGGGGGIEINDVIITGYAIY